MNALALPQAQRQHLAALAARMPVGARVRHSSGWTATVQPDTSGAHPGHGLGDAPAHVITGTLACVFVDPDDQSLMPMWMSERHLSVMGGRRG